LATSGTALADFTSAAAAIRVGVAGEATVAAELDGRVFFAEA